MKNDNTRPNQTNPPQPPRPNEHEATANLQRYLRRIAGSCSGMTVPPIDGVYEEETRRSVSDFQKAHGIAVTGTAEEATWDAVYEEYCRLTEIQSPPVRMAVFPEEGCGVLLGEGQTSFAVAALQYMLCELSEIYSDLPFSGTPTGVFDASTARSVELLQSRAGLSPSGSVDRVTWNRITEQYNLLAAKFPRQ